ncbi:MAG: ribonuclease P protein component [Rickettsiales bacterium]|jgi:ribonuclease P protein component|nr:ribonuclease P protein component [Rickettsiales bacterium]
MRNTLKKHQDFAMAESDPTAKAKFFIIRAHPTLFQGDARYGLVATKKTFKLAVHRNRAKRCLRVWIREKESLLNPDFDYVFIARRAILDATKDIGIAAMTKALKYLKKQK